MFQTAYIKAGRLKAVFQKTAWPPISMKPGAVGAVFVDLW